MTEAEARAILGPEVYAEIQARPTKPLTPAQISLLAGLLTGGRVVEPIADRD